MSIRIKAKAKSAAKGRIGQSFDDFLKNQGTLEETHAAAIKRVIAWQLSESMRVQTREHDFHAEHSSSQKDKFH